jgi:hypothetical protein
VAYRRDDESVQLRLRANVLTSTGELVEADDLQWTQVTLAGGQSGWASAAYLEAGQCTDSAPANVPSSAQ